MCMLACNFVHVYACTHNPSMKSRFRNFIILHTSLRVVLLNCNVLLCLNIVQYSTAAVDGSTRSLLVSKQYWLEKVC